MRRKHRNTAALMSLKDLGYPLPSIRSSFFKLTGITQQQMAEALGVSRQGVTNHINGIGNNRGIKKRIAEMFEVPPAQFWEEDDISFDVT